MTINAIDDGKRDKIKVLVADDEAIIRNVLEQELLLAGYRVAVAENGEQVFDLCENERFEAIILDMQMPKFTGMEVLRRLKHKNNNTVIILITAYATVQNAVDAMKLGADDYLTKPFDNQELLDKLEKLIAVRNIYGQTPMEESSKDFRFVGVAELTKALIRKLEKIKELSTTVLITGESGTGKSVIARLLHNMSARRDEPFIHVDCTSLSSSLVESELFGHEKGAFTSAYTQKKGKFAQAGKGTIFLDEIGSLPREQQSKLLNVLQERQVYSVGGAKPYAIHARVLAATNRNLEEAVKTQRFREDLYYRLNVIRIECPPLRYRKQDILELVEHFIATHCAQMNRPVVGVDEKFLGALMRYSWPGNVRELQNLLEGVLALSENAVLTEDDLPLSLRNSAQTFKRSEPFDGTELRFLSGGNLDADGDFGIRVSSEDPENEIEHEAVSGAEREHAGAADTSRTHSLKDLEYATILRMLKRNNGHREKTALELGISKRALQYKLKYMKEQGMV
jgi:DNA-binding NtrC family response regulator